MGTPFPPSRLMRESRVRTPSPGFSSGLNRGLRTLRGERGEKSLHHDPYLLLVRTDDIQEDLVRHHLFIPLQHLHFLRSTAVLEAVEAASATGDFIQPFIGEVQAQLRRQIARYVFEVTQRLKFTTIAFLRGSLSAAAALHHSR